MKHWRAKRPPKEPTHVILQPRDGAFVFRFQKGLELFIPDQLPDEEATHESIMAMMLAWIIADEKVRREMQDRFTAHVEGLARDREPRA